MEVKDAERKEEDQVIYDCHSILSNQLIVLLPFRCPVVNTHPRVALSQQLTFFLPSLFVSALNTFSFVSIPAPRLLGAPLLPPLARGSRCLRSQTAASFMIPGCSCGPKEA